MPETPPGAFKSQPWILFDTVAAESFLLGDTTAAGLAKGSQIPALDSKGEMVFFNGGGRTTATFPWYTNIDLSGQLAYGMEVWQIYLLFSFPAITPNQNNNTDPAANPGVAPTVKLMESFINYGVLELELGQENQTRWPLSRFGAGGGMVVSDVPSTTVAQNSQQQALNVMKLAEPIEMPRTQNFNAKIRLSNDVLPIIGTPAAPGVGNALGTYDYVIDGGDAVNLAQPPYAVQLGFVGRRVKKTQYGQIPGGQTTPLAPPA